MLLQVAEQPGALHLDKVYAQPLGYAHEGFQQCHRHGLEPRFAEQLHRSPAPPKKTGNFI